MSLGIGGIVSLGGSSAGGGGSTSGIQSINNQNGPFIIIDGVNGIEVITSGNIITIDGSALSGISPSSGISKYATNFAGVTSGLFTHSLGTSDIEVQIQDTKKRVILPNNIIIENTNQISLLFNIPQTGRLIIIG